MVFLHLKLFLPQEYIAPCKCFSIFHWRISIFVWVKNNIYLKNIRLCTSVFNYFCWRIPLCELTVMVMPSLEYFSTWRIYTSVWVFFNFFCWRIPLCELTLMVLPSLEYVFYLKNIHLCTSRLKWCFLHMKKKLSKEYTPLCELTKMTFSTLKMFSSWSIYTSVQAYFNFSI